MCPQGPPQTSLWPDHVSLGLEDCLRLTGTLRTVRVTKETPLGKHVLEGLSVQVKSDIVMILILSQVTKQVKKQISWFPKWQGFECSSVAHFIHHITSNKTQYKNKILSILNLGCDESQSKQTSNAKQYNTSPYIVYSVLWTRVGYIQPVVAGEFSSGNNLHIQSISFDVETISFWVHSLI